MLREYIIWAATLWYKLLFFYLHRNPPKLKTPALFPKAIFSKATMSCCLVCMYKKRGFACQNRSTLGNLPQKKINHHITVSVYLDVSVYTDKMWADGWPWRHRSDILGWFGGCWLAVTLRWAGVASWRVCGHAGVTCRQAGRRGNTPGPLPTPYFPAFPSQANNQEMIFFPLCLCAFNNSIFKRWL